MKTLDHKLIIYDSNCKVCSSLKDVILGITSIPAEKVAAYKDLDQKSVKQVDEEKFKNVMALIDTRGEATIYGAEGVAYIFSSQYKWVDILLRFKPFYILFAFLYKVIANNRYIIATPKSFFQCDCFPDKIWKFRIAYIIITVLIASILTALLGVVLKAFIPGLTTSEAAVQMLLIAGSGWVLQMLLAFILIKGKAFDYIGHLGSIMVVGLLIQVPCILLYLIPGPHIWFIPVISLICSSAYMLYLHIHRVKFLQMSAWWNLSWFLFLQSGALFWIYEFYLK